MGNQASVIAASNLDSGHIAGDAAGNTPAVTVTPMPGGKLIQLAAWPESLAQVASLGLRWIAAEPSVPVAPGCSRTGAAGSLLRVEPLKYWAWFDDGNRIELEADGEQQIVDATLQTGMATLPNGIGTALDLSGGRTRVCVAGVKATELLNRFVPIDLRVTAFPEGRVATTSFEHMGVTLWHREDTYDLFMPSSFAESFLELLCASQQQFNVVDPASVD